MNATPAQAAIRRATPSDIDRLSTLMADAFLIAPVGDWLIPGLATRRKVYIDYFDIFIRHGLRHGMVEVNDNLTGAAIWFPQNHTTPEPDDYDTQLAAACGPWTDRFKLLDDTLAQQHPAGVLHHYLAFLAVAPNAQSRGIGSALLERHHRWLDRNGIPAFLEASEPRNRDLYLRHGYQANKPFHLPQDGPPLWPMWRDPKPAQPPPATPPHLGPPGPLAMAVDKQHPPPRSRRRLAASPVGEGQPNLPLTTPAPTGG
ncbi:GNAT family N-acetyltransferase [Micromonospora thermarum]|uniref:GNAT family N-acetyltransferase n=1 Tax=Micromonospora thermarum TaxID=2720024 RepID=A0ABX0ZD18_9ACTN|nr:GNAT family N-acetyltransferase [Micromonospora thermarum]NJP35817.1 GNAT family N-acetyltransferase [Micromonospora thermarum]